MYFVQHRTSLLFICLLLLLSVGCTDDDMVRQPADPGPDNFNPITDNFFVDNSFEYNRNIASDIDRVKIALSVSLANILSNDNRLESSFKELIVQQEGNRILAANFNNTFLEGESILALLLDNLEDVDSDLEEVITNICEVYPHLSIGSPLWVGEIPTDVVASSDWVVFPAVRIREESLWRGIRLSDNAIVAQGNTKAFEFIPLQIKEAEDLIPYREGDMTTIWGDRLIEDHFPILNVCDNQISALSDFSSTFSCNSEYYFLDIIAFRNHLRNTCFLSPVEQCFNGIDDDGDGLIDSQDSDCDGAAPFEICDNGIDDDGDGLIDSEDADCTCNPICGRDCNDEFNAINRIGFVNQSSYFLSNSQAGGEDVISIRYHFVAGTICGDPQMSSLCPASTWTKVYYGSFLEFFEVEEKIGPPSVEDNFGALFIDPAGTRYWDFEPINFDIPVFNVENEIYAQASYLETSPSGHFDGALYGNLITVQLVEHDNAIVEQFFLQTSTVRTQISVPNSLQSMDQVPSPSDNFSSYTFSNIRKTSEYTLSLNSLNDVDLARATTLYCDPNFENEAIGFGINKSTGLISTVFAYY